MRGSRIFLAAVLTLLLAVGGAVAPATAAPKGAGQLVVRIAGVKKAPKRVLVRGPVKRTVTVGKAVSLPPGSYRLVVPRAKVGKKRLKPRGVPKRVVVRRGALSAVDVLYGTSYLTNGKPVSARLSTGAGKLGRDGGAVAVGGTRVVIPDQYRIDVDVRATEVKRVKGLGKVGAVRGVLLDWQGGLSAPITLDFGRLKRGAVVFASQPDGSQAHLMPRRRTIEVDRPGAYFVADRGLKSVLVKRGFVATMPRDVPSKLEHIVGAKTLAQASSTSRAQSELAAQPLDDVRAHLAAETDYIKTYVLPAADAIAADCGRYTEALSRVIAAERMNQLLGDESQNLFADFIGAGRLATATENCVREIAEPCVKPADVGDVFGYARTLALLGDEDLTPYLNGVIEGILSGEKICKTVAVPQRLVGTLSAVDRQEWEPGHDRVTTWQASVTLELANVGAGLDPPFQESAQYRVTALDGTWTKSGDDGLYCSRSGNGSLTLADLPADHLSGGQGLPIYTNPWQGFVYAMNMQSGYRTWSSTVRCTYPDGVYQYTDDEESPASFLSTNRWDLLTPLSPLPSGRDPAGAFTLDDWPFHRTTWTWDLKAEADKEYPRPGEQ